MRVDARQDAVEVVLRGDQLGLVEVGLGVARVVGLGNKIDMDENEVLEFLSHDDATKAIFLYLESFKRPRQFIEVARRAAALKPVFMLKGGATKEGSQAAIAHTAALASDERVVEAAMRQSCITQLSDYSQLFNVAKAISFMPLPRGNRISFMAPSGAMLACHTRPAPQVTRCGWVKPSYTIFSLARLAGVTFTTSPVPGAWDTHRIR